ncbi:hypothetical protein [Pseudoalteromonas sp. Ld20]|uniref:hypothetical protein n=1 Tax=Pseudoalteromonas sp. Ld20 TaxID=649165 RepID=UPI003863FBDF
MMTLYNTLFPFVTLLAMSFSTYAKEADNYASLKKQLSTWLANSNVVYADFTITQPVTITTNDKLAAGGEVKFKASGKQCVAYAPHRFYDIHTYRIALALFEHCQVFLANTVHRNTLNLKGQKTDLGKYRYSTTNAFLDVYSQTVDTFTIYQIHGFDAAKRRTKEALNADVIISRGNKYPNDKIKQMSQCLVQKLHLNSVIYPIEVKELGGTKNILNTVAPRNSHFFHIELSNTLRARLIKQPTLMSQFNTCITL